METLKTAGMNAELTKDLNLLQQLIDNAVQKGMFANVDTVIAVQSAYNNVKETLLKFAGNEKG